MSLVTECVVVFLCYLSCYLFGVRKGDEDLELKQKHYLIGQLSKTQQIVRGFIVGKQLTVNHDVVQCLLILFIYLLFFKLFFHQLFSKHPVIDRVRL